jgi:hypothetical protein
VPAFFDHLLERPFDFDEWGVKRSPSGIEHDVPLGPKFGSMTPESLAQPPLDPVPDDRPADRARHRKTEPHTRSSTGASQTESCEHGTRNADAVVIDHSKIGGAQNPGRLRKRERAATGGLNWLWQFERLSRR